MGCSNSYFAELFRLLELSIIERGVEVSTVTAVSCLKVFINNNFISWLFYHLQIHFVVVFLVN